MTTYKINPKAIDKLNIMLPMNYRTVWLQMLDGRIMHKELLAECLAYVVNLFSGQKKYIHIKGHEQGILRLVKLDVLYRAEHDDES